MSAVGLGVPFVPFTFPTVLFCRLAKQYGYDGLTWGVADLIWAAYQDGRAAGEIPGGNTTRSRDYLVSRGIDRLLAAQWLAVAEHAAELWWGQGTYFADFGATDGVVGAASGVVQGAAEVVGRVGDVVVGGIARSLGLPRWLLTIVVVAVVAVVGVVAFRTVLPRALRG